MQIKKGKENPGAVEMKCKISIIHQEPRTSFNNVESFYGSGGSLEQLFSVND